jgi:D-psicose/D-tagatose/L-ribulose 3-epimerase
MKLSCIETMLGERSLADKFELARGAGFDGLDLRGDELAPVVDQVRDLTARTGIEVPTVYGRLTTPLLARTAGERAEAVATLRDRLRDAAAVGATSLIVVPVFGEARIELDWPEGIEQAELALLAVLLAELADDAAARRVRIVLEPLNRRETHLLRSAAVGADLARRVGSEWVATMVDTYHMDLEGQDAVREVEAAADRIQLVHLSDRERRLPGEGGIDFRPLLGALEAHGYRGYLGYECRGPFGADQLRRSVAMVRQAIAGEET